MKKIITSTIFAIAMVTSLNAAEVNPSILVDQTDEMGFEYND